MSFNCLKPCRYLNKLTLSSANFIHHRTLKLSSLPCRKEVRHFNMNGKENVSSKFLPSAGIIVIGDELLKGQTADVNIHYLTKNLYKLGVKVQKISIIADDVDTIAEEVSSFSKKYTHVITSGGIGPTHDDVTFEGVACAFNEKVKLHGEIVEFVQEWFKTNDESSPAMKMARLPESATLYYGKDMESGLKTKFPCVVVRNVVIFPGIPHLLQKKFEMLGQELFGYEGGGFFTATVFVSSDEVSIAAQLNQTVNEFPRVTIGSYPDIFNSYYRTKVTLECLEQNHLDDATKYLRGLLDKGTIVDYISDTISDPWPHFSLLSTSIRSLVDDVINHLHSAYEKYSPEEIILCFNGGKDCLVVLHIFHSFLKKSFPGHRIQAVYIEDSNSFPQVNQFVQQCINRYDMECEVLRGSMKAALSSLLRSKPSIKAVVMGTRRIDPHGDQVNLFSPTDGDWPPLMRISPILDWKYDEVWAFIRQLFLPYCSLYDRGYTSLGGLNNTLPNPSLETKDALGRVTFLPAYQLSDPTLERKGRHY